MKKFLTLMLGAILGIAAFVFVIHGFYNMHITAVFEDLEPFPKNLNVYYKGFKLGRTVRVHPSKDFMNTHVEMILNAKNLRLPDNTTAKMKSKNKKDYIELEYPNAPSITFLKNHSIIRGTKGLNIGDYIDKQAEAGGLDEIKDNLNDTVASAGDTLDALTELFGTANDILKDIRPSLKITAENMAETSKNLKETSAEINQSLKPKRLSNSVVNIEQTTKNIERTTKNLENASLDITKTTKHINTDTISIVDCVIANIYTIIDNINVVINNTNDIVIGFQKTLNKRFAGMKIMFGRPIS